MWINMKGMPNQGLTIGLYLLLTTLLFLSVNGHVVLGEINTNMPLNMPTCPLNSSIVLMLTPEPILPSKNMIVTYGPLARGLLLSIMVLSTFFK
jgi:hypothetical protein